jgi:hypothetical protein
MTDMPALARGAAVVVPPLVVLLAQVAPQRAAATEASLAAVPAHLFLPDNPTNSVWQPAARSG